MAPGNVAPGNAPTGARPDALPAGGFEHRTVSLDGVRLHHVVGGSGDPVVLLHGWPLTWRSWRKVMPALAGRHLVIVPDLRGLGDSGRPEGGYDKRTIAEDVRRLVGSLGHEKVSLVGHDMGALVAYTYAAEHPDEVRALAILDVPMVGFGLKEWADGMGLWHFGFHQSPNLPEALTAGREREYVSSFYRTAVPGAISTEDVEEYVRCYSAPGAMRAGFEYYRALSEDERRVRGYARGGKLPVPVLALGGEYSGGPSPFASMAQLAGDVRGGVIPGAGHYLADERPDELARELLAFFGDLPAASEQPEASRDPRGRSSRTSRTRTVAEPVREPVRAD